MIFCGAWSADPRGPGKKLRYSNNEGDFGQAEAYDCTRLFSRVFPRFSRPNRVSLTRPEVEGIAHLARLAISESQLPVYVGSLSKILNFVEQLNAAQVEGVE